MDKEEVIRYLNSSKTNSICIDRRLLDEYPGFVRDITIKKNAILKVEFNVHGYNEGGLTVTIVYENLEILIKAIEKYITLDLINWGNINKSGWYPELESEVDFETSGNKLKRDFVNRKLSLPIDGKEYIISPGYWKDLLEGRIS